MCRCKARLKAIRLRFRSALLPALRIEYVMHCLLLAGLGYVSACVPPCFRLYIQTIASSRTDPASLLDSTHDYKRSGPVC
jgi:hypothetical protein